ELARGEARDAGPQVEARPGREGQVGPVEIEVLAVEVPGERLVGRDRVVRVAGGAPDGRRQLVGEGDPHAEPGADALAVARGDDGTLLVRLMVDALVAGAHVAEDRRALEPVGQLDRLLRLGGRGLALLGGLLDLLLRRLADRLLLLELAAQLLHLVLGLPERIFQLPEPLLGGGLGAPGSGHRQQHRDDRTDEPALLHRPSVRFGFPPGSGFRTHWLKTAGPSRAARRHGRDFRTFSRSRNVAVTFAGGGLPEHPLDWCRASEAKEEDECDDAGGSPDCSPSAWRGSRTPRPSSPARARPSPTRSTRSGSMSSTSTTRTSRSTTSRSGAAAASARCSRARS